MTKRNGRADVTGRKTRQPKIRKGRASERDGKQRHTTARPETGGHPVSEHPADANPNTRPSVRPVHVVLDNTIPGGFRMEPV